MSINQRQWQPNCQRATQGLPPQLSHLQFPNRVAVASSMPSVANTFELSEKCQQIASLASCCIYHTT